MRDLIIFFEIVFQKSRISFDNLQKFADITIQRIANNNPGGIYTAILTALTNAYTAYFGDITDEKTKLALKEGSTITMNNAMIAFIKWVRQMEGIITGTFGIDSSTHQEFYPHGMTEYTNMNLGNALSLMVRFINVATIHTLELPPNFVTTAANLHGTFKAARALQNQLTGEAATERTEKYGTRKNVEIALMACVLFIAFNNIGNTAVCAEYFDQSFLKSTKPKVFEKPLLKGAAVNLYEHEFEDTDEIKAENTGTTPWRIFLATAPDIAWIEGGGVSLSVEVAPGETVTIAASNLGDVINNNFLNITNLDAEHDGSYKVTV